MSGQKSRVLRVAEVAPGVMTDNSLVYMHPDTMDALGLFRGDIVLLRGRFDKATLGVVLSVPPEAQAAGAGPDQGEVQVCPAFRLNLDVLPHDHITLEPRLDVPYGTKIDMRLVASTLPPGVASGVWAEWLRCYFLGSFRPLHKGDLVVINEVWAGERVTLEFRVTGIEAGDCCIVGPDAELHLFVGP